MDVVEVASGVWQARAQHVCWVVITDGTGVTLVDTGYPGDKSNVVESLRRVGRTPADVDAVVLTHGHPDHIGNAEHFRSRLSTPVWVHEKEVPNATGERVEQVSGAALLRRLWQPSMLIWFTQVVIVLQGGQVRRLKDAEIFTDQPLDIPGHPVPIETPGHTSGHVSLHLPDRGVLLAGDALMTEHALATSPGPQLLPDYFHSDPGQARRSLEVLRPLQADVVVPGHGPAFYGTPEDAVSRALRAG